MTAKGQQEFELSGAKFGRNFITLLTSDQCQERICFHTDSGEAGGGCILQRRKILADQDVGMGNWLFPPESPCVRGREPAWTCKRPWCIEQYPE